MAISTTPDLKKIKKFVKDLQPLVDKHGLKTLMDFCFNLIVDSAIRADYTKKQFLQDMGDGFSTFKHKLEEEESKPKKRAKK